MSVLGVLASEIIKKSAPRDVPVSVCAEVSEVDPEKDLAYYQMKFLFDSQAHTLKELKDNHELRMGYANKIFFLVCTWLACVIAAVLLAGFHLGQFTLSDKVLITFITSTTINVLGLFAIVAKWLFQQNGNGNKSTSKHPSDKNSEV